jgi:hypothetical protein
VAGRCEHGKGHSLSIKGEEFLDPLYDYEAGLSSMKFVI